MEKGATDGVRRGPRPRMGIDDGGVDHCLRRLGVHARSGIGRFSDDFRAHPCRCLRHRVLGEDLRLALSAWVFQAALDRHRHMYSGCGLATCPPTSPVARVLASWGCSSCLRGRGGGKRTHPRRLPLVGSRADSGPRLGRCLIRLLRT